MFEKRTKEIEARKADILKEIETADEARMKELTDEVDKLNAEMAEIRSKQDLAGKLTDPIPTGAEARTGTPDDLEIRAKQLRETRSVTIGGGKLVQPKKTGNIKDGQVEVSSIVDQVNANPCEGMGEYQVPYVVNSGEGEDTEEGAEVAETDPTFDYATITPGTITTYSEVSREVLKLSDKDYLARVEQAAVTALRKKVAGKILSTADDAKFTSIFKAAACVTDVEIDKIDHTTLRKIILSYGGDEAVAGGAVLYLSKADLIAFGDVRGTSEKKALYEIIPDTDNPNTGIIKEGGASVRYCLNKKLTPLAKQAAGGYSMAFGNPMNFELGVFSDYTVTVDESAALKRRMIAVLGEVMIGGNVAVYDGFVRIKKAGTTA